MKVEAYNLFGGQVAYCYIWKNAETEVYYRSDWVVLQGS